MTRKNLVGTALAVLTTGLVLTACGSGSDTGSGGHDMGSMTGTTSATSTAAAAPSGEHNDADITFAQGMIPHHQGALEMAELAEGRTSNAKVLDLASRIEKAQDPEIKTMTDWLKAWGAEAPTGMPGMDHGTSMPGMGTEEMDMLKQAKDAGFDKMFLEMMIEHHQGAIDMSNTELQQGSNADAKKLAQDIIDAQQKEITEMQDLLKTI
ncbi:DUF305 domain-containing protein [Saccharothrix deserti]|uniref:DUF305 domain-containing protein n=1 Tax=Saccharothrix deserti TaxID=2593674 RepID=UPI00131D80A7|nr:DUF305 domain-containing protein [Saccharothrix deserti]